MSVTTILSEMGALLGDTSEREYSSTKKLNSINNVIRRITSQTRKVNPLVKVSTVTLDGTNDYASLPTDCLEIIRLSDNSTKRTLYTVVPVEALDSWGDTEYICAVTERDISAVQTRVLQFRYGFVPSAGTLHIVYHYEPAAVSSGTLPAPLNLYETEIARAAAADCRAANGENPIEESAAAERYSVRVAQSIVNPSGMRYVRDIGVYG